MSTKTATRRVSGFCNGSNPPESHTRCHLGGCVCDCHTGPPLDALAELAAAVERVDAEHSGLIDACTDPQGTDVAELLYAVQAARIALQRVESVVENACAKSMLADQALTTTLRVERYRANDRRQWQHDDWQRDVRQKALQAAGLKGAQGVLTADGEVVGADALFDLMSRVQQAHSSTGPRTTALKALGLDPADYCETTRGAWHVKVQRLADETETEQEVA